MTEIRTTKAETILSGLNEAQRKASLHKEGPLVVFAGAGSGKTRIITSRIALLIESGVRPSQILAVTFTNKAAQEMKERVLGMSNQGDRVWIGTFHSTCARWLREFAPELGFSSDFTIYDDKDSVSAIKNVLKSMNLKTTEDKISANDYKAAIATAKTHAWLPHEAEKASQAYPWVFPFMGVEVYKRYQELLAQCNAMDFSDLLLNMLLLLKRNEGVRDILQKRHPYILVDEYQDTNRTQFELISYLINDKKNLFVVGDDDQSIYSWRGADPSNILEFTKQYPDAVEINLEQNYRCTGHIVNAASALIANNKTRADKTLWTANDDGEQITFHYEYDGEMEAWAIVDQIVKELKTYPYEDVAIFYRTNAQSRQIEDALRREGIPYQIFGSLRFYDRAEVKDILSYIKLIHNEKDDIALTRIINTPTRGIGKKAVETISEKAEENKVSMLEACRILAIEKGFRPAVKVKHFLSIIDNIKKEMEKSPISEVVGIILKYTDYKLHIEKKFPEQAIDKIANIHELGAALADYEEEKPEASISQWLQDVSLLGSEEQSEGGVSLMTLHSAKGLEFNRVFLTGLEEGLIPHTNSMDNEEEFEEERRLLYVGITRAKKKLSLTCAQKRRVFNVWMANQPSRFLREIPNKHFANLDGNITDTKASYPYAKNDEPNCTEDTNSSAPGSSDLYEGVYVSHPTYGKGTVAKLENEFGVQKATVEFNDFGKRKVNATQLTSQEATYSYDV